MTKGHMKGKRVVITQVQDYMGPAMVEVFEREGAHVIKDTRDLREKGACSALIKEAGHVDVLIANNAPVIDHFYDIEKLPDEVWHYMFDMMVHPLHRLCKAVLPQMYERKAGKIVVIGSITGLHNEKSEHVNNPSAYSTARTAQVGYVRAIGHETIKKNVQINLIAQHFTYSETFFPKEYQKTEEFKNWLKHVPAGRLATGDEDGELALFLASERCNFITGTSIPFTGGWHLQVK